MPGAAKERDAEEAKCNNDHFFHNNLRHRGLKLDPKKAA
jgi:hypothetical protein